MTTSLNRYLGLALLSILLGSPSLGHAALLTVLNPGFESPDVLPSAGFSSGIISNWTVNNTGLTGVFDPTSTQYSFDTTNNVAGTEQVAYASAGGTISQTLTDTLAANTTYTLTVQVGNRADFNFTDYSIQLFAGATLLGTATSPTPGDGAFVNAVVTYQSPSSVTAGQLLSIVLNGPTSGLGSPQANFDNVTLDASPTAGSAAAPEPTTLSIWGLGALGCAVAGYRRRKTAA